MSSIQTPQKLTGSVPPVFLMNRLNNLEVSSWSLSVPPTCNARALRRHKLSVYGFWLFSSNLKNFTEGVFNSGSGNTVSLQTNEISLSNAAKIVTFISLKKFHFVFAGSLVHYSMTSVLLSRFLISVISSVVTTSLDVSKSVLCSCAKPYLKLPSSSFLSIKPKVTFNLAAHLRLSNKAFNFSNRYCGSRVSMAQLQTLCHPFFISLPTKIFWFLFQAVVIKISH